MEYNFYYYPLCPLSQKVHWLLMLYNIPFKKKQILKKSDYLTLEKLLHFSPFPLLEINPNEYLTESLVISDYINNKYASSRFSLKSKYMENILDNRFYNDVYTNVVYERTLKMIFNSQPPNIIKRNRGLEFLSKYLNYFESIFENNYWINESDFSFGDISLFTALMCLDYCGEIPWMKISETKKWYNRLKHTKEAKVILSEHIGVFKPPKHYSSLDF